MKQDFHKGSETLPTVARTEHEQLIQRLLSDPTKSEAMDWLQSARTGENRTIGACETNQDSVELVREIYNLGAMEVFVVNIHPSSKGRGERSGKLVVALPQNPKQRSAIFGWCKRQGDSLGFTPDPDQGESHLFLMLD
jgi:hypothetical protein